MNNIKKFFSNFILKSKQYISLKDLTKDDTLRYKALAIMMIVLHNFFHGIAPKPHHNEFSFSSNHWNDYIHIIFNQPEYFIQASFSYFGHYGVQIFLFLSAYGLTKQYMNHYTRYSQYLKYRIIKIYPAFILSFLFFILYISQLEHMNPLVFIQLHGESIIYKLTFISNFIKGELVTLVGPWWFISLIVQFYIIFPLLIKISNLYNDWSLFFISIISILLTAWLQPYVPISLGGTVLSHIPEFSLGIFLAKQVKYSIQVYKIFFIIGLFYFSNLFKSFWYISDISALILLLFLFQFLLSKVQNKLNTILLFLGTLSIYIFYTNGFLREPLLQTAKNSHNWFLVLIITCGFISIVLLISYLLHIFEKAIQKWADKVDIKYHKIFTLILKAILLSLVVNALYYIGKNVLSTKPIMIQKVNDNTLLSKLQRSVILQYKNTNPSAGSEAGIVITYENSIENVSFSLSDSYPNTDYPKRILYKVIYHHETIFVGDIGGKDGIKKHRISIKLLPDDKNILIILKAQEKIESNWGWGSNAKIKVDFTD